jgi:phosphoribosylaminoimidazole-succinocarboxamide synthase
MEALKEVDFAIPGQISHYKGKVRDVFQLEDGRLMMVTSDRISAFDVILPRAIPYKGQVLTAIAARFLEQTNDIVPNWLESVPDPQVMVGKACEPYRVEMVIRAYLTGHAWRVYRDGGRELCGVRLPEGLKEHDRLPELIITPATKAEEGHDEDISREEIIRQGIVPEEDYLALERYTRELFKSGTAFAAERGLILVDTKYEFGTLDGEIMLIDEIHTPDSSRYFYAEGYEQRQENGRAQKQLSKEFVREWLISEGFQGREGDRMPNMDDSRVRSISERYIELYEILMGDPFPRDSGEKPLKERITGNIQQFLMDSSTALG